MRPIIVLTIPLALAAAASAAVAAEDSVPVYVEHRAGKDAKELRYENGHLIAFADGRLRLEKDAVEVSIAQDRILRVSFFEKPDWWREQTAAPPRPVFPRGGPPDRWKGGGRDAPHRRMEWMRQQRERMAREGAKPGKGARARDDFGPGFRGDRLRGAVRSRQGATPTDAPDTEGLRKRFLQFRQEFEPLANRREALTRKVKELQAELAAAGRGEIGERFLRLAAALSILHRDDLQARRDALTRAIVRVRERGAHEVADALRRTFRDLLFGARTGPRPGDPDRRRTPSPRGHPPTRP